MLDDLYRETILEHYRQPRHRGRIAEPTVANRGSNPLCGDQVEVGVRLDGERLVEVGFEGLGCSISQASASMMSEAVAGRTVEEVRRLAGAFRRLMAGTAEAGDDLGDLEALQGVRKFPARVKCATLAWTTLEEALDLYTERRITA